MVLERGPAFRGGRIRAQKSLFFLFKKLEIILPCSSLPALRCTVLTGAQFLDVNENAIYLMVDTSEASAEENAQPIQIVEAVATVRFLFFAVLKKGRRIVRKKRGLLVVCGHCARACFWVLCFDGPVLSCCISGPHVSDGAGG